MTYEDVSYHLRNRTATGRAILRRLHRTTTDPAVREDVQIYLYGKY